MANALGEVTTDEPAGTRPELWLASPGPGGSRPYSNDHLLVTQGDRPDPDAVRVEGQTPAAEDAPQLVLDELARLLGTAVPLVDVLPGLEARVEALRLCLRPAPRVCARVHDATSAR